MHSITFRVEECFRLKYSFAIVGHFHHHATFASELPWGIGRDVHKGERACSRLPYVHNVERQIATNALGVCNTKQDFVYVLVGWEGSASDSRIPTSSPVLKHVWTKEKEGTLVECLVDLVSMGDENSKMRTSRFVDTFVGVGSNEPTRYEGFDIPDRNEKFASVYSQGIDMSDEDVRPSRPSARLRIWRD
ncbi:retrotransposon protein [Cucumis melo var. makuwa]|uniref:Retrotransposon protein n=1 Tax=Cucumis melo var. makuwa TaxID=1194695 RepID=A0A5A7TCX7_CUCMM|nr:retrotransposon protein [Cucumis melo var. makuwa]TYK00451.1 retrotransposon protein [Cucumis melo var. makuwa]